MALIAKLYDNGRTAERHPLDADATVRGPDQIPVDVLVADISATGCLFMSSEPLTVGSTITIGVAGIGRREARIVRAEDERYGCLFLSPLGEGELSAGLSESETISLFPHSPESTSADEAPALDAPAYPGIVKLATIVGMTAVAWALMLLAIANLA